MLIFTEKCDNIDLLKKLWGVSVKYYGLKNKYLKEEFIYRYAKANAKIKSVLPGKRREFWKDNYSFMYRERYSLRNNDNSLPANHTFYLNTFIVADMIRREDIYKLQKGIKRILKKYRSGRFLSIHNDGLDEICNKIEHMDSTLSSWYTQVECGLFEFKNHPLESVIDYFSLSICNINSAFLSLKFEVNLSEQKKKELNEIIGMNYADKRGYAYPTLVSKSKEGGAFESYSNIQYNDDALKADQIYEFLSMIEWEFMEALSKIFPFVLHKREIMPPRIEIYYTDIDYHEECRAFWSSIGISNYQGQFIDERHKMFFDCTLSGRYERYECDNRLLYIVKDDGIERGRFKSVKDDVYYHMREYSIEYFRILFLRLLTDEAGKNTVIFKQKLDTIKLKKNRLLELLKLKYSFSLATDDYNRYMRDDCVENITNHLKEVYIDNEKFIECVQRPFLISYKDFCESVKLGTEKVEKDIEILLKEFEDKKQVLQNLSDYKNTERSMRLNFIMLLIAVITLFFLIFPEYATKLAEIIMDWKTVIVDGIEKLFGAISCSR